MEDLTDHLCFNMDVVTRMVTKYYNRKLVPYGITYNHYFILLCLWKQDGVNIKDLAEQLCLEGASLTGHLDRMERIGLLRRADDPKDRRAILIFLTARGWELRDKLEPLISELRMVLTEGIPKDYVKNFQAGLEHIGNRLDSLLEPTEVKAA